MKKSYLSLLFLLTFSSYAYADVYYATPPTVYVEPSPSYQTYQAIGNLLGAIIQSSQANQAAEQQQKQLDAIRDRAVDITTEDALNMKNAIEEGRAAELMQFIEKWMYSELMATPVKNFSDGIFSISCLQEGQDNVKIYREYTINTNTRQCRSIMRISPLGIDQSSTENFEIPMPKVSAEEQKENDLSIKMGNYLGIIISPEKLPNGGFQIINVIEKGIAEFAGVKKGDILKKIDVYDLKEYDLDRVIAYVDLRAKQNKDIKVTVLRNNQPITLRVQL